jgi:hypothetical protein
LQTAVELYDVYQLKITGCENKIEQFESKLDFAQVLEQSGPLKVRSAKVRLELQRQAYLTSACGVDLTRLPGLSTLAVEVTGASDSARGNGLRRSSCCPAARDAAQALNQAIAIGRTI